MFCIEQRLQKFRCALSIDAHISADLVHGLPHPNRGRKMKDHVDTGEHLTKTVRIANIAHDKFYLWRQIIRPAILVYLRCEIIQNANPMACAKESIGKMRADETGSPGNQDLFWLTRLFTHNGTELLRLISSMSPVRSEGA